MECEYEKHCEGLMYKLSIIDYNKALQVAEDLSEDIYDCVLKMFLSRNDQDVVRSVGERLALLGGTSSMSTAFYSYQRMLWESNNYETIGKLSEEEFKIGWGIFRFHISKHWRGICGWQN